MLIEKTPQITIDYVDIDKDHDGFIELINKMEAATDADFKALFAELFEHTEKHFERENQLMQQYSFPATNEHMGEHHRVLSELKQFKKRIDRGMLPLVRAYIKEQIPQWFNLHVTTMDSALAAHISKSS